MAEFSGFRYNGVHSSTMGVYSVTDVRRDILPPINSRLLTVPGRGGAYYQGHDLGVREIEVDIVLRGTSQENLRSIVRALAAWLRPDSEPKDLIFDDEPSLTWKAVLSNETDLQEIAHNGFGTLTFVCPDPVALGPQRIQTIAVADATFARNSVAYKSDGTQVAAGVPRFEAAVYNQGLRVEESTTTNLLTANQSSVETDTFQSPSEIQSGCYRRTRARRHPR